jgi:hypothetical protein
MSTLGTVIVNSPSELPEVIVGVAGVFSTLAAAIAAVVLTQGSENRRWNAQQVNLANVARADRLREIYGRVAVAAEVLRSVIQQKSFLLDGETIEERDARHDRSIEDAMARVAEFGGQIMVESSAQRVRDDYSTLVRVTAQYLGSERDLPPGPDRANLLNAMVDAVVQMTDKIVTSTRQHLAELETPAQVGTKAGGRRRRRSHGVCVYPSRPQDD